MRLMVSDLKGLVLLAYPLVTASGMLQLNSLFNVSRLATTAIPVPTTMQLFMGAMVYPLFLTAFFRIDGAKAAFQVSTVIFISAVLGLVVYPTLAVLCSLVIPGFQASTPWFNVVVLILDVIGAFAFLFALKETDLHKISPRFIWGSLLVLELGSLAFVLWQYGVIQQGWAWVVKTVQAFTH